MSTPRPASTLTGSVRPGSVLPGAASPLTKYPGNKSGTLHRTFSAEALGEDMAGVVFLDVFAGSGVCGREARRRGAVQVRSSEAAQGPAALLRVLASGDARGLATVHLAAEQLAETFNTAAASGGMDGARAVYADARERFNSLLQHRDFDHELAATWLFLNRVNFNGLYRLSQGAGTYNVPMGSRSVKGAKVPPRAMIPTLKELQEQAALSTALWLCDSWRDVLPDAVMPGHDLASTGCLRILFDPPYYGSEVAYCGQPFDDDARREAVRRIAALVKLGARAVLHDNPGARIFYEAAALRADVELAVFEVSPRTSISRDATDRNTRKELYMIMSPPQSASRASLQPDAALPDAAAQPGAAQGA